MTNINIKSTSRYTASTKSIVLRDTEKSRLIFEPLLVNNPHDQQASVKGRLIYQKKTKSGNLTKNNGFNLNKLRAEEWIKLDLKSGEIKDLFDNIANLKSIYEKYGIVLGESNFEITEGNVADVLSQLSKLENKDLIISVLEKLKEEDFKKLSESLFFWSTYTKKKTSP